MNSTKQRSDRKHRDNICLRSVSAAINQPSPALPQPVFSCLCSAFHLPEQAAGDCVGGLLSGNSVDDDADDSFNQQIEGGSGGESGADGGDCAGVNGDCGNGGISRGGAISGAGPGSDGGRESGRPGLWPAGLAAGGLWDEITAPWSRFG